MRADRLVSDFCRRYGSDVSRRVVTRILRLVLDETGWNGGRPPSERSLVAWLEKCRARRLSETTMRHRLILLREFLEWHARDRGESLARVRALFDAIPRKLGGAPSRRREPLSPRDVRNMVRAIGRDRNAALAVSLMAFMGLRRAEVLKLRSSDVRRDARTGTLYLSVNGKGGKMRHLAVPDQMRPMLVRLAGNGTDKPLLPGMSYSGLYKIVSDAARRAGIRRSVGPHDLRRYFATTAIEMGVPVPEVQDALGHAKIETTLRYRLRRDQYSHRVVSMVAKSIAGG